MRKGFTLTEMMICLLLMGIIASIVTPSLKKIIPNKDQYLYKGAYRTLEKTVTELVNDADLYPSGNFQNATDATYFCDNFSSKVNTIGSIDCSTTPTIASGVPNFATSNGQKWWGLNNTFASEPVTLWVDINGDKGDGVIGEDVLRAYVYANGKITVTDTPETTYLSEAY